MYNLQLFNFVTLQYLNKVIFYNVDFHYFIAKRKIANFVFSF